MSDTGQLPPRPLPPRHAREVAMAWLAWLGIGRLVLGAIAVIVVAAGAFWLVRAPVPPAETTLPEATASTLPEVTLAAPAPAGEPHRTSSVVVHVAGAVHRPGVYELDASARVNTAVDLAGGATAGADLDGLNLAAPVTDGQRIYVPEEGEVDPGSVATPIDVVGESSAPTGPIDLNRATVDELDTLPGVGPATAAAIVDERIRNGPFASVDDLRRVPGIGPAKLDAVRDLVTV